MKTRVLYLFAAVLVLFSCTNENIATVLPDTDEFYCSIENEEPTRTSLDQNNNVIWSAEDQLVIFKKSSIPSKYQISESHVGKTSGSFYKVNSDEFNAGSELDHNVALYPYQENVEITKLDSDSPTSSYKITGYNFPAEQTYTENSFANGAFPMAAVSDNYDLTFRNICGGIKLQLKGTQKVTSIKIEGKNAEKLAGNADVVVYSDENLKPAITVASNALTSVILNCGAGVQLTESAITEFILSIPPLVFSKGFIVTISDNADNTYTIETDKANTILRSSILVMPTKILGSTNSGDNNDSTDTEVESVKLNQTELVLKTNFSYELTATVIPADATYEKIAWSSDNPSVVAVSNQGLISTLSSGIANITAEVAGKIASCSVKVITLTTKELIDYEELGVNYGKGVAIGNIIWAPVNCGYQSGNYKYESGKLYQWGRKYGQYYYDDVEVIEGPISIKNGQKDIYENTFFLDLTYPYNWASDFNGKLWNKGSDINPIKSEYDPCPTGWRIPTSNELNNLVINYKRVNNDCTFSGEYTCLDGAPKILLPTTGYRDCLGNTYNFSKSAQYYSSDYNDSGTSYLYYYDADTPKVNTSNNYFADGCAIRCVQE